MCALALQGNKWRVKYATLSPVANLIAGKDLLHSNLTFLPRTRGDAIVSRRSLPRWRIPPSYCHFRHWFCSPHLFPASSWICGNRCRPLFQTRVTPRACHPSPCQDDAHFPWRRRPPWWVSQALWTKGGIVSQVRKLAPRTWSVQNKRYCGNLGVCTHLVAVRRQWYLPSSYCWNVSECVRFVTSSNV